jgi:hypothetical protein
MDEPTGKRCTKCGEIKPPEEFGPNRQRRDGLDSRCRMCCAEIHRLWYAANPDRGREISRRSREANPERAREASRRWNAAHPEAIREAARRHRQANPQARPGTARRRRAANPEASREAARRRHAANRKAVLDHYGRSCACCGTTKRLGIDHVNGDGREHRAQIGAGSSRLYRWLIANGFPGGFQVLCGWCNKSKADGERCNLDHQAA